MKVRRIVMGHDHTDASVVVDESAVEPTTLALLPGAEIHRVWETDHPALPVTDTGGVADTYFPGPGGVRFGFLTIPPGFRYDVPADLDIDAAMAEAEEKLPGMAATFDPERPGMHTTATVDYIVCISGEARMVTDGDVEVMLQSGDCLIQNGTAHAWFNDGTEPVTMAYALCGVAEGDRVRPGPRAGSARPEVGRGCSGYVRG